MPIYEYNCAECGVFETTQRITEDPLEECPTCQRKVRKLISNTSFQLKGSGWYVTDYGRGKDSNGDKGEGTAKDGSTAKDGKDSSDSASSTGGKASETGGKASEKSSSGDSAAANASQ